jgi:signal transduction histidine kinase/HAMP domain-containing protein
VKVNVRGKIILISMVILFIALGSNTLVNSTVFTREFSGALKARAFLIGDTLASQLERVLRLRIPLHDIVGFEKQCRELSDKFPDIAYAMVVDLDGKILFHDDPRYDGQTSALPAAFLEAIHNKNSGHYHSKKTDGFFEFIIPVHDLHGDTVAAAKIGYPVSVIAAKIRPMVMDSLWIGLFFLLLGMISLFVSLNRWVNKPLAKLMAVIQRNRRNGTDTVQLAELNSKDEIGELAATFNQMIQEMNDSRQKIKKYALGLEKTVQDRTADLEKINRELQHDMEARKKVEEALRENKAMLAKAQEIAGLGSWSWDLKSGQVLLSDEMYRIFEFNPVNVQTVLYKEFLSFVKPPDKAWIISAFETAIENKQPIEVELKTVPIKDQEKTVHVSGEVICNSAGKPFRLIGAVQDVTQARLAEEEQKRLQTQLQQIQKMEAIGTLAGGIAHDFNNILTAIFGFTELAVHDAEQGSELYENLQEILSSSMRAKNLVQQILTFSRQKDQKLKPTNLKLVLNDALKLLRATLPTTIDIQQNIQSGSTVMADASQIHQVVMNLGANAGYAMQENGGILTVDLKEVVLDENFTKRLPDIPCGSYAKLSVSDTGHGIDSDVQRRLFEPFFTTKPEGEGTGMGLSLVHGIVKNHGGTVTVSSEIGKGSIFNVFFPVISHKIPLERVDSERIPTGTERILLVDDERAVAISSQKILQALGYHVEARMSGLEAWELFKQEPDRFDLVITDMTMPKMTGEELARNIIDIRSHMPIILCSGFSASMDEKRALALGIRAFVLKPIPLKELAKTVRSVLDGVI